jgi:hypothetical protein
MLQIQLYVENDQGVLEEVELYKDESITLTQSIQDIMDIQKVFTDYSKTFNVPASKTNNKFFKHFYNYHIDGFDARRKKNAELHLNYKPFKKGKIKLEGTQLKNNEPHTYKLTFFGNTVTLKDLVGEDKLGNLTLLDNLSFTYNDTNIEAYMTDGLDGYIGGTDEIENAIIFPLITHTDRLIYDSTDTAAGTNNVYYEISDTNAHGVKFNQLKPALRVYAIIKAIEHKYEIEFSNDFFNSTNLSFYNLYMWLHAKEGSLFDDQESQYTVSGFTNVRGDTRNILGVHDSSFNNSYDESKQKRTIRVKVTPTSSDEYSIVIKQNGEEFNKFTGLTGTTTNGVANNVAEIEIPNGEYTFFIEATNAATFAVDITIEQTGGGLLGLAGKKQITFTGSAGVLTDENINITSNLPKMKTLDFLTGIFKMFNLTSFVDDNGKIVVKTLDSFYAESTNTWDITKHLDKEESIIDSVIPYRQVNLGYKGGDTFLSKNHENLANKKWGTLEYAASDKFEGDEYNIELPFEHMKFERLREVVGGVITNIQWGWSVDSKQESTIGEPLLFYVGKPIATIAAVNIAGERKNIVSPWVPSNSLTLLSLLFGTQSQSLNFHSEIDEYSGAPNQVTLFETYYKDYIKELFDKQKRLTFVSAYLPMSITERLSLADKIIVFDNLYRINKITTNFETNKSDLELSNILEEKTFNVNPLEVNVDLSNDIITADSTILSADIGNILADGFTIIGTPEVPDFIESNEVSPPTSEPCEVTAATITNQVSISGCDNIIFRTTILTKGTLCGTEQIDEFGFLLSSTESDLTASDDIDTLKADSNIQVVPVIRQAGSPSLTTGQKTTTKTGLTDPATQYARFYVRTNTSDLYAFADTISDVFSETTSCGEFSTGDSTSMTVDNNVLTADVGDTDGDGTPEAQVSNAFLALSAGTGDTTGYSSIPTLAEIDAKEAITQAAGRCGETLLFGTMYHNGDGDVPVVGDSIKMTFNSNYAGGYGSFPQVIGPPATSNDYGVFAFGSTSDGTFVSGSRYNLEVTKYLVFQWSTAKVVDIIPCVTVVETSFDGAFVVNFTSKYVFGEYQGQYYGNEYVESFKTITCGVDFTDNANIYLGQQVPRYKISHTGSGLNPIPGDFIKIDKVNGVDTDSTFGAPLSQLVDGGVAPRFVFVLVDGNFNGRYLIGVERDTGEVQAFAECI